MARFRRSTRIRSAPGPSQSTHGEGGRAATASSSVARTGAGSDGRCQHAAGSFDSDRAAVNNETTVVAEAVALPREGGLHAAWGYTAWATFPTAAGYSSFYNGGLDAFVTKLQTRVLPAKVRPPPAPASRAADVRRF